MDQCDEANLELALLDGVPDDVRDATEVPPPKRSRTSGIAGGSATAASAADAPTQVVQTQQNSVGSAIEHPFLGKRVLVVLRDGQNAQLTAVQRSRNGAWFWQLAITVPDGSRPASASHRTREEALLAWVARHGHLLASGEGDRLEELAGDSRVFDQSMPMLAEVPAVPIPTPPPPPPPRAQPRLVCPLCTGHTPLARPRNLVRHLALRHAGQQLGERGAAVLHGLDQGICGGCRGIRSFRSHSCLHCPSPVPPPRPAMAEDQVTVPQAHARRPGRQTNQDRQPVLLPPDWTARVRALPGQTLPHVPACVREATAVAMAQSLEALMADGPDVDLEQGRAKLLLAPPPKGFHLRSELEKRHRLWRDGDFEALLTRAETQAGERQRGRGADTAKQTNRGRRAKKLAREQAYRKGVAALTGSLAALTPDDEERWAGQLLPPSGLASGGAVPAGGDVTAAGFVSEGRADDEQDDGEDAQAGGHATTSLWQSALRGVRFPALSGAGPSGCRPEHLREALTAKRRSVTNRLLRAIAELSRLGRAGELPASTRWLLDSKVVFLPKPGSDTPRPIRVGEVWRRLIAKRMVSDQREKLQRLFLAHRQCGVGLPGGAEALIHLRRCLEQAAAGVDDAAVVSDLDLRNAFPSLEWPAVRAAVRDLAPEAGAWTNWCHGEATHVQLPCGKWIVCDRGAEQGDPWGPAYCGLVFIRCAEAGRRAVEELGGWVWDAWYMDDGQVVLPPHHAAVYLTAFDAEPTSRGGTRLATDGTFKSEARLVGAPEARAAVPTSWAAGIVAATCRLQEVDAGPRGKVLGVELDGGSILEQLRAATGHTAEVCQALRAMQDPWAEMARLRVSANVCRVVHLLRASGPDLDADLLADFDGQQSEALGSILGGPVSDRVWDQAAGSAGEGGLGLHSAEELRYPAFLASRTQARPLAEELTRSLPAQWRDGLLTQWTATTAAAMDAWAGELSPDTAHVARQVLEEGAAESVRRTAQLAGRLPRSRGHDGAEHAALTAASILAGPDDVEHPDVEAGLQARLSELASKPRLERLRATLRQAGDWEGVRLWEDLCDSHTDHRWLWVLAAPDSTILSPSKFVDAVRLRLGADITGGPSTCARCGGDLDAQCRHALRCAPGPATRGHNRVRDTLLGLASLADGTSATEVRGLVGSAPSLRPADLLTTAAFGRLTALDVGIANPAARTAGSDACVSMVEKKLRDYAAYLAELKEDGVEYRPMIWSCWGRPHTDASNAVRSMAQAAARRHGAVRVRDLERRACRALGVQFWKRAAQMVDACRPALAAEDVDLVLPASVACARARLGRTKGPGNSSSCCSSRGSSNSGDRSRSSSPRGPSSSVHPPSRPSDLLAAGGAQFEGGRGAGVGHVAACDSAAGTCVGERALAEEAAASGAEPAAGGLAGGALRGGASAALLGGEGPPGGLGAGAAGESRAPRGQEAG